MTETSPSADAVRRGPLAPRPERTLLLMAAGALVGLALAGYGLLTAKGVSTLAVPAEDVAVVNQQPISRTDYLIQLRSRFGVDIAQSTPAQKTKVLDEMIREELFVQRGKELDVAAADPDVRAAMVAAVEQEIDADAVTSAPGDEVLRRYYAVHRDRYASEGSMTVRDLVFPPAAGRAAAAALAAHPAIADTLGRFGGRESGRTQGEEFYFAARIHLGARDFDIARGLTNGAASAPLIEGDGTHILFMIDNAPPTPQDFTRVRDQVLTDYRNDAARRLMAGSEAFFRKRAHIQVAEDLRR